MNIYFLVIAIRQRRQLKITQSSAHIPSHNQPSSDTAVYGGGRLVRVLGPLLRVVNQPWKMYPVGILFGFGGSSVCQCIAGWVC